MKTELQLETPVFHSCFTIIDLLNSPQLKATLQRLTDISDVNVSVYMQVCTVS